MALAVRFGEESQARPRPAVADVGAVIDDSDSQNGYVFLTYVNEMHIEACLRV